MERAAQQGPESIAPLGAQNNEAESITPFDVQCGEIESAIPVTNLGAGGASTTFAGPHMSRRSMLGTAAVLGGMAVTGSLLSQAETAYACGSWGWGHATRAEEALFGRNKKNETPCSSSDSSTANSDSDSASGANADADNLDVVTINAVDEANYHGEGHSLGHYFTMYPVFSGETDKFGFHILTEQALGCRLAHGACYRVNRNITLKPSSSDFMAALVADCNLIYIEKGCKLTVYGSDAHLVYNQEDVGGRTPFGGLPGIALYGEQTAGRERGYWGDLFPLSSIISSLMLTGEGSVEAHGGSAGKGENGQNGHEAELHKDKGYFASGDGGKGGNGGGGGGAGIGTAGATGGIGDRGGFGRTAAFKRGATDENGWDALNDGHKDPRPIYKPGTLCIAGEVGVWARGGGYVLSNARGGNASSWKKWKSGTFTKHLTGGSGGGGAGGDGMDGNGYGMGGPGGIAGGGGGSAGAMWRTLGTSDEPPTGSGGQGGRNIRPTGLSKKNGDGQGKVHRAADCEGGKGSRAGTNPYGDTTPHDSVNYPIYICGDQSAIGNRTIYKATDCHYKSCSIKGAYYPYGQATQLWVSDATGFSEIYENGWWYIKNPLLKADGKGTLSYELVTIAGFTQKSDLAKGFGQTVPDYPGYEFLGWAFDGDTSRLVWDAKTKTLNEAILLEKNLVEKHTTKGLLWMGLTSIKFTAVWKQTAVITYSIVYHTNGGQFTDLSGKAVSGTSYTETGHEMKAAVTLWNNSSTGTIGKYLLKPPSGMPASTQQLGWATKVDDQGYAAATMYGMGETVKNLNPRDLKEINLYAIWKTENKKQRNDVDLSDQADQIDQAGQISPEEQE